MNKSAHMKKSGNLSYAPRIYIVINTPMFKIEISKNWSENVIFVFV